MAAADARELFRATAACLHLGAISFLLEDDGSAGSEGVTHVHTDGLPALRASAELLGLDTAALQKAITVKQVKAGVEWIAKANRA